MSGFNHPVRRHLIPEDVKEHELSPSCWCRPTPDEDHDEFTHHKSDQQPTEEQS